MTSTYHLGVDPAGAIAGGLFAAAPFTGPAAPFVAAAGALVNLGDSIMHMVSGCGPTCDHDTQIVEGFEMAAHGIWFLVTGEALPGIPGYTAVTTAGNYGAAGINLFQNSAYPAVPYPAGAPGVNVGAAIQSLQATLAAAEAQLVRQQSIPNIENNYHIFLGLLQQVQTAAAAAPGAGGTPTVTDFFTQIPAWGWAAIAAAVLLRRSVDEYSDVVKGHVWVAVKILGWQRPCFPIGLNREVFV
jgi:hypothetical protein